MPPLSSRSVGRVAQEMLKPGFTLVGMPRFVKSGLGLNFKKSRTVLLVDSGRWWRFPELARYACWLERLLDAALPDECLVLDTLEYRCEPAGSEDSEVDRWHADGSFVRSIYTLYGQTTVYRDGKAERSVPDGMTLLMTGLDRAGAVGVPCTLHRRPGAGPERAVIVCSFEPRGQQPSPVSVFRRVAHAQQ